MARWAVILLLLLHILVLVMPCGSPRLINLFHPVAA